MEIKIGKKIDDVPVKINYKIIELFSAGLYSSANKAFEELICNSYDAIANNVSVYIPDGEFDGNSIMWICDDGSGMNQQELKDLWRIGYSNKRNDLQLNEKRLQIGQFGIGKLSTYILANKLTYITKNNNKFFLATMDYSLIKDQEEIVYIDEKEASEAEVESVILPLIKNKNLLNFKLFGKTSKTSWTFAILSDLKEKASEIKIGRLSWILRSALPLSPVFNLKLNGTKIQSSKLNIPILKKWIIGKDDSQLIKKNDTMSSHKDKTNYYIDLSSIKNIKGEFILYEDSLLESKSDRLGRSNGIFLFVRGRLVNLDDPLLGMDAISHGVFNRLQVFVYADELDQFLTSTRESIKDTKEYVELKKYLSKKINEIREFYYNSQEEKDIKSSLQYRIKQTSEVYIKKPINEFLNLVKAGKINSVTTLNLPPIENIDNLISDYASVSKDKEIIKEEKWESLSNAAPIVNFDFVSHRMIVNLSHPFVSNFMTNNTTKTIVEYMATSEFLTEILLHEKRIDNDIIKSIMKTRDNLLRSLVLANPKGVFTAVHLLNEAKDDADGLENATAEAFRALGFSVEKIGGSNKPDGIAEACSAEVGSSKNYKFTYDAKSTKKDGIRADTANQSGIRRHKNDYKADYAIIISRGYQGQEKDDSAISKEAKEQKITLFKIDTLIKLLIYAPTKQFNFDDFKICLEEAHTPNEVDIWVKNFICKETKVQPPYKQLLKIIYDLQHEDTETPTLSVIRREFNKNYDTSYSKEEIDNMLISLHNLAPRFIDLDNDKCTITQSVEFILSFLNDSIEENVPIENRQIYIDLFSSENKNIVKKK
ncbi:ATP-binding protein [Spiroplasma sp. DGKH1]|uniref:ATP-binding protein n=1 Tax=Spiroplasma sp. DGKH1 TaxID=3050074 RepID=UPI0034C5FA51